MSLELEQWVVCVRQLEDVLVLQTLLLLTPPQGAAGGAAAQCSIKTLLEGGTGGLYAEMSPGILTSFLFGLYFDDPHLMRLNAVTLVFPYCYIFLLLAVYKGGIADSVSKWVFRHHLAPERLKEFLQKREDEEQRAEEERKVEKPKSQQDTDRTAGEE